MKTSEILWQDTQHQILIKLLDELEHDSHLTISVFNQLTQYVATHFSMEERYMEAHAYPNTEVHKAAHRRFEQKLGELKKSSTILNHGLQNDEFRKGIVHFLRTWLMDHIFGIDKDLESYLLQVKSEKVI